MAKSDYGVKFVNIELRFKADMYFGKEDVIPDEAQLFVWIQDMAREFWRFGFSYNENNATYTASATYKGGKSTDTPPCVTQHGKSPVSSLLKLYIILEIAQGRNEGFKFATDVISQLEDRVEIALEKLL